ncbi:hypothetical protein BVG19_g1745 [[Candida] boidinii]|nr:hypothetical protein BVG19_g1745 [[Candida] boidinii]OWB54152.1 hypothetical protein B5S27_g5817 [[Candida] boidinii]
MDKLNKLPKETVQRALQVRQPYKQIPPEVFAHENFPEHYLTEQQHQRFIVQPAQRKKQLAAQEAERQRLLHSEDQAQTSSPSETTLEDFMVHNQTSSIDDSNNNQWNIVQNGKSIPVSSEMHPNGASPVRILQAPATSANVSDSQNTENNSGVQITQSISETESHSNSDTDMDSDPLNY